ncbi:MAG TPA: adenylyltransferase/cytidyltransferase family protein [Candidatus Sulfotelmatobacter sp.]|jgi:FAD synthetase|nr:adenylyltransferase/cytidyltransferase family protein [Candidatus Sulfotelmatobacter sp.]
MADKIAHITDIEALAKKFHTENKQIVILGGCFDLLHVGHIAFLEEAKKHGDVVIVLLESDETITATKGPKRPINSQEDRAKILSALTTVDIVILLKPHMTNKDYDALVFALKPDIIATTSGDSNRHHKERQAKLMNAQVIDVTMPVHDQSTTKLVTLLNEL